jgi:hypothetical protein
MSRRATFFLRLSLIGFYYDGFSNNIGSTSKLWLPENDSKFDNGDPHILGPTILNLVVRLPGAWDLCTPIMMLVLLSCLSRTPQLNCLHIPWNVILKIPFLMHKQSRGWKFVVLFSLLSPLRHIWSLVKLIHHFWCVTFMDWPQVRPKNANKSHDK